MNDQAEPKMQMSVEFKAKARILVGALISTIGLGTILFHFLEKWSWVDSFYFICVTIATIGYGDFYPTTDLTKILTVVFSFAGIGMLLLFLEGMSKGYIERKYYRRSERNKELTEKK